MQCMNPGRPCPRHAQVYVRLYVPGFETDPITLPRCIEHAAWVAADSHYHREVISAEPEPA